MIRKLLILVLMLTTPWGSVFAQTVAAPFTGTGNQISISAPNGSSSASTTLPGAPFSGGSIMISNTGAVPVTFRASDTAGGAVAVSNGSVIPANTVLYFGLSVTATDVAVYGIGGTATVFLQRGNGGTLTQINTGGGGTPGGSPGYIQYNNSGAFGGEQFVPIANGGTGQGSPSLVAGSNVTITGTWPNQTVASSGGGGGLTVGTSTITGGATTKVLFDNAGVLGEYVISGSGNVCMTTSCAMTTPNLGTPSAVTLTNGVGLPVAGLSNLGSGWSSPLTAALGSGWATALGGSLPASAPLLATNGSSQPISISLGQTVVINSNTLNTTVPNRTVTTSPTVASTDMGGVIYLNVTGGGTVTIPAIGSGVFGNGQSLALVNYSASTAAISTTPTINAGGGCVTATGIPAGDTWEINSNGTTLDCNQNVSSSSGGGTVTHTGGALTANSVVLGAGAADTKVVAGIVTDGTSKVTLGVSGTSVGAVALNNATSGSVTVQPVTGALGSAIASLPANTGTLAETNLAQTWSALQTFGTNYSIAGVTAPYTTNTQNTETLSLPAITTTGIDATQAPVSFSGGAINWANNFYVDTMTGVGYNLGMGVANGDILGATDNLAVGRLTDSNYEASPGFTASTFTATAGTTTTNVAISTGAYTTNALVGWTLVNGTHVGSSRITANTATSFTVSPAITGMVSGDAITLEQRTSHEWAEWWIANTAPFVTRIGNYGIDRGHVEAQSALTNSLTWTPGNPTTVTTSGNHGLYGGASVTDSTPFADVVVFSGVTGTGASLVNGVPMKVTVTGATTFTVNVNTTTFTLTGGTIATLPPLTGGYVPASLDTGVVFAFPNYGATTSTPPASPPTANRLAWFDGAGGFNFYGFPINGPATSGNNAALRVYNMDYQVAAANSADIELYAPTNTSSPPPVSAKLIGKAGEFLILGYNTSGSNQSTIIDAGNGSTFQLGDGAFTSYTRKLGATKFDYADNNGNVIPRGTAGATGDTDAFWYMPNVAGTPTGTPGHLTGNFANGVPTVYDTTNHRICVYDTAWKCVAVASIAAPTISSGFGTSPSVTQNNGPSSFSVNVGTGGTATSGVVGLPTAAHGWACSVADVTTASSSVFLTKQTASSTTTATIGNFNTSGVATAWVASDILQISCQPN